MQAQLNIAATRSFSLSLVLQFAAAALIGVVIIYGVGFSPIEALHNAAHNSRHSHAFPCH
ncbi:MAG TPA: CbtB domain-containing protein [Rugosibacter sp.]